MTLLTDNALLTLPFDRRDVQRKRVSESAAGLWWADNAAELGYVAVGTRAVCGLLQPQASRCNAACTTTKRRPENSSCQRGVGLGH